MTTPHDQRPDASEHAPFYAGYVASVPDGDIVSTMRTSGDELDFALRGISEEKGAFRYAEGKWTVKTLIGHLIDGERIFAYRALAFARGDAASLPGFEENDYALTAGSDARTVADLADEMAAVRECTVRLFASLPDEAWSRRGVANGSEVSVRAIAWMITGHALHHLRVLRERYGI